MSEILASHESRSGSTIDMPWFVPPVSIRCAPEGFTRQDSQRTERCTSAAQLAPWVTEARVVKAICRMSTLYTMTGDL